jgi:hypothetical protein
VGVLHSNCSIVWIVVVFTTVLGAGHGPDMEGLPVRRIAGHGRNVDFTVAPHKIDGKTLREKFERIESARQNEPFATFCPNVREFE